MDIVLGGNLYGSEVETPRNDASLGLFLKGNGEGDFEAMSVYESGLQIKGEVRHIEAFKWRNGDRKCILVAKSKDSLQFIGF